MALCVALPIASEFMPVRLLTPVATDLHATEGMAGQAAQDRKGRGAAAG
jgi:predicted MFS family arabinose efflux permease